ncbi:hypothetical protein P692DRAFT_20658526, partial [Suillus brevipes Sb2]
TVPPFYDQEQSGAPPLFPPMLTDQLELLGSIHRPTTLIADEIIVSIVSLRTPPALAPEFKIAKRSRKPDYSSPYPKKAIRARSRSMTPSICSDSQSSSNHSFDSGSSTSITPLSEDSKIPKPLGEAGGSGRGRYILYDALNWSPKKYTEFKKFMYVVISDDLTTTQCASAQSPAQLEVVRNKAIDRFPDLEDYSDLWPVNDIITTRLKYTSRHVTR